MLVHHSSGRNYNYQVVQRDEVGDDIFRCVSISSNRFVTHSLTQYVIISLLADLTLTKPFPNLTLPTRMVPNVPNGTQGYPTIANGAKWYHMVLNGTQWCQMVPNVTLPTKMVPNGTKWNQIVLICTLWYRMV